MEKGQVEQYNMLLTVELHFDINVPIWSSNVLISDAKTALSAVIAQVSTATAAQGHTSRGATLGKARLREDLEEKGFFVSTALSAYSARYPSQNPQFKRLDITRSRYSKLRGNDLLAYIEELYDAAMGVVESLEPYGVTPVTLSELVVARTAFQEMMNRPKDVASSRKDATETIAVLLKQGSILLEDTMDQLMRLLRAAQPDFVNVYFLDRKIHHIGVRTLSLEITTLDARDNSPLADARIEVVSHGIKRRSGGKGKNKVQNLKEGYYTLSVSHPDFVSQMIPFTIVHGETTQIVIEMGLRQAQAPLSSVDE